jgi:hypothetical protein
MADQIVVGTHRRVVVRRERPNALTAAKRGRFLDMLAASGHVERAAAAAAATAAAFYRLRQRDAAFAAAWAQALDDAYVRLEAEMLARAMGTAPQPAGEAARVPGDPAGFDAKLALDLLKRRDALALGRYRGKRGPPCRHVPIEEVERLLLERLEALARRGPAGPRGAA